MLRFAMPATVFAGVLLLSPSPARAADDVCVGVAVTVGGLQQVGLWPPACAFVGVPSPCLAPTVDLSPVLLVEVVVCGPSPVTRR